MELGIVKGTELLTACARLVHSIVLQMKGENEMQSRAVAEMNAVSGKYDYKYLLGFGKRLEAMAAYRRHDIENALELLDASTCYFDEIGNTAMASSNTLYRYLWQSGKTLQRLCQALRKGPSD
jgi:hypothetical protein